MALDGAICQNLIEVKYRIELIILEFCICISSWFLFQPSVYNLWTKTGITFCCLASFSLSSAHDLNKHIHIQKVWILMSTSESSRDEMFLKVTYLNKIKNKHSLRINPRLKFGSLANQATGPRIIGRRLQNGWCAESATTCLGYLCVKAKEPLEVIRDFSKLLQAGS